MSLSRPLLAASTALLLVLNAGTAFAQSTPSSPQQSAATQQKSFTPEYFAQFQPITASDMVSQIPGFTLQGGDDGERGFGQASLNILINGRRPSSKTSGADLILSRIPANKVVRIDIKDGASLDIPGLSGQVIDIITGGSGISGSWNYAMRFWEGTDPQIQDGGFSISGERGDFSYVASLGSGEFKFTEVGRETFSDGAGNVFEDRREDLFYRETRPSLNVNLTYAPANGHVANINLSGGYVNRNQGVDEFFTALTPRGNTGFSLFNAGEDELEYEIGGDYAFPIGNNKLKLIALHRFEDSQNGDIFAFFPDGGTAFDSSFIRDTQEGEYIGRAEYDFKTSARHGFQLSAEGAFNYLDRDEIFQDTNTPQSLNAVRVEEKRAESNLTHSWKVTDKVDVQTSIGAEYSQLSVPTVDEPSREFVRPKGFISASYNASETYTWRAKLEREVGQLDFNLFTDGISLTDNFTNSGNSQIVPTQSWNAEVELERLDSEFLSATVRAFVNFIDDPFDRIRFLDGTEGPGNLDSATEYGIEANATWLLSSIGIDGMRLELAGALRDSRIDDPITDGKSRLNDQEIWEYDVSLRYDIPQTPYAIGAEFENDQFSIFRRLDQTFNTQLNLPESRIFAEHKELLGMTVRLVGQNIFNEKILRERVIFASDRNGNISEIQNFERQRGRRISIEISDTF